MKRPTVTAEMMLRAVLESLPELDFDDDARPMISWIADRFRSELLKIYFAEEEKWINENNIKPNLSVGDMTTKGKIARILSNRAQYQILTADSVFYVNFEDAIAVEE